MGSLAKLAGANIRRLRRARGLSQEALGAKSGVDFKYVGSIERGQANFTVDVLEKIARALETSAQEIFAGQEPAGRARPRGSTDLLDLLQALDAQSLSFVRDVVASYVAHRPKGRKRRKARG